MNKHYRPILIIIFLCCPYFALAENKGTLETIKLAATTSIDNSGLIHYLLPKFTKEHPYKFDIKFVGSGKALRLGRTGMVDLVWVHSPVPEQRFISEGYGIKRHSVMRNDFILAGPAGDPGKIGDSTSITDAFMKIASQKLPFVSRADDSGTHKKEKSIWKEINIDPYGEDWYIETGANMKASLDHAKNILAYVLVDQATFIVRNKGALTVIVSDPGNLNNTYSLIAVNPKLHSNVNSRAANTFIQWLISDKGQKAIGAYKHVNTQLFYPIQQHQTH